MAAIMLMSLAPLALAREITPASVIDKIEIVGPDLKPTTGKLPKDMEMGTVRANGTSFNVVVSEQSRWYDDTDQHAADLSMPFEAGHYYSYCWVFTVKEGFEVSDSVTVTIDGSDELYDDQSSSPQNGIIWSMSILCEDVGGVITLVDITNVCVNPPAGGKAGDYRDVKVNADSHATLGTIKWYCVEDNCWVEDDDTFEEGKYYCMRIMLQPMSGYSFTSDTEVLINGSKDEVSSAGNQGGDRVVWTKSHLCGMGVSIISKVDITDVKLDITAGDKVGDYMTVNISPDSLILIEEISWRLYTGGPAPLTENETFKAGVEYVLRIRLKAVTGYEFASDTEVLINGSADNVLTDTTYIGQTSITVYSKPCKCEAAPDKVIDRVELTDVCVTPPAGGKAGDYLTVNYGSQHVNVKRVFWYSCTDDHVLGDDEAFEKGISYVMDIVLEPMQDYVFADNAVVLINGSEDYIDTDYTKVAYGWFYIHTKPLESVDAPSVMLGDLNGDGKVNTADAVQILKSAAGMIVLDEKQQLAGDTNHDGKVNTADAVLILKYAAGMISAF